MNFGSDSRYLRPRCHFYQRYSEDQPRDADGKFGSGGGEKTLGKLKDEYDHVADINAGLKPGTKDEAKEKELAQQIKEHPSNNMSEHQSYATELKEGDSAAKTAGKASSKEEHKAAADHHEKEAGKSEKNSPKWTGHMTAADAHNKAAASGEEKDGVNANRLSKNLA